MMGRGPAYPAVLPSPETPDIGTLARAVLDGQVRLVCVLGPTASGKTRFAVTLAKRLSPLIAEKFCGAEILSADSRQVFRGMDIGTGKDLDEYDGIPYHLIDILPAGADFSVYEFKKRFEEAEALVASRGAFPILCGGTGLYINSVAAGYRFGEARPLSSPRAGAGDGIHFFGTLVDREERNRRIDRRLDERLAGGLVEEVRRLLDEGVGAAKLISYGLEYKYVTRYVLGEIDFGTMREQLSIAIHRFAKRQMTWFRGMERSGIRIHWVLPDSIVNR